MATRLAQLADQFMSGSLKENPQHGDSGVRVNEFMLEIEQKGYADATWSEEDWVEALTKLGVPDDEIDNQLENVAGWGVVDDGAWMAPDEKAVWDKLFDPVRA